MRMFSAKAQKASSTFTVSLRKYADVLQYKRLLIPGQSECSKGTEKVYALKKEKEKDPYQD